MSKLLCLYLSHKLTERKPLSDPNKLNDSIKSANIDLNPHQVDAAIFAFKSPLSRGAILADEVGLGKTIEAGLIINQLWVEGRNHILILVPASLRTQWQEELSNKFNLESTILDSGVFRKLQNTSGKSNPLYDSNIYIASHNFASRYNVYVKEASWDLIVIDEAHRMRNVWRKGNKTAKIIRDAIKGKPKILLTATPLQNNLMELFGLTSFIDENYLGTEFSFRTIFANPVNRQKKFDSLKELKSRLMGTPDRITGDFNGGILTRTLRKQVRGLVPFTNRFSITEDFAPNDDEMELYNHVSEYLRRPYLASTRATQRNMMELVYRKILASSSFAIAGTLLKIILFLSKRLQLEQRVDYNKVVGLIATKRSELERELRKQLPEIEIKKFEPIDNKDKEQEILPGFEDIESTPEKTQEEVQDADDLGEDSQFEDQAKKIEEREIDHIFKEEEIINELNDVLEYYFLATTISENQKSQALVRILKRVFEYAQKKQWPQKAVIFTESRRTQDHLEKLLSGIGYELVLFNGTNASIKSHEIYEEWVKAFPDEAKVASRSINIRKALVWKFRSLEKAILITTEAGAEGLNLQFANIVINYDLPWNPQRVEQRIGRCHRYGQKLDVLVVNFLNKRNYADQRVYELLKVKIKLFGNLFNFSDKVLGTEELTDDGYEVREVALAGLGTGIDFERKVLEIYRKCRTEKEIENSFQQLQLELSDIIEEKVEDAQKKVIQHFDAEVQQKLKIRQQQMNDSLSKYDADFRRYLTLHFGNEIHMNDHTVEFKGGHYILGKRSTIGDTTIVPIHANIPFVRSALNEDKLQVGSWNVTLSHSKEKERKYFEDFIGKNGQLTLDIITCRRKTINNQDEIFEKLIVNSAIFDRGGWKLLNAERAEKLFELNVIKEASSKFQLFDRLIQDEKERLENEKQKIIDENEEYVDHEMQVIETFIEESMLRFKKEIDGKEGELKELKETTNKIKQNNRFL